MRQRNKARQIVKVRSKPHSNVIHKSIASDAIDRERKFRKRQWLRQVVNSGLCC